MLLVLVLEIRSLGGSNLWLPPTIVVSPPLIERMVENAVVITLVIFISHVICFFLGTIYDVALISRMTTSIKSTIKDLLCSLHTLKLANFLNLLLKCIEPLSNQLIFS